MNEKLRLELLAEMTHPSHVVLAVLMAASCTTASNDVGNRAAGRKVEFLWAQDAPYSKGNEEGDKPTLTVHQPPAETNTGAAVVICPGGGYRGLAVRHEGHEVAEWLNSLGVAGLVLKYRTRRDGYGHPAPLADAQRAIRMARSRAKQWNIDPNRIGILGFSAGGHLASTVGTHFDAGKGDANEAVDRVSCRPDFMILIYPVISFAEPFAHKGSRRNLLGEEPDAKLLAYLSNEKQVTSQTPATFLVHTTDDKSVSVENSISFYLALKKNKVPVEMHIYQTGRHGFGLGTAGNTTANWPSQCARWMKQMGLLDTKEYRAVESKMDDYGEMALARDDE